MSNLTVGFVKENICSNSNRIKEKWICRQLQVMSRHDKLITSHLSIGDEVTSVFCHKAASGSLKANQWMTSEPQDWVCLVLQSRSRQHMPRQTLGKPKGNQRMFTGVPSLYFYLQYQVESRILAESGFIESDAVTSSFLQRLSSSGHTSGRSIRIDIWRHFGLHENSCYTAVQACAHA